MTTKYIPNNADPSKARETAVTIGGPVEPLRIKSKIPPRQIAQLIEMAPFENQRGKRMWPSLPVANHVADVANIFFIGSLVVGVVSTVLIVWMANVKEGHWDRARQESEERIASLVTQGDEARAILGTAQADIAKANADAAQARAEQERLKAQLAWRVLPPEIVAKLEKSLSEHPSSINIQHVANDTEALYLAIQIANIFAKVHWQVGMMSTTIAATIVFGIWIPDAPSSADVEKVRNAFKEASIDFSTDPLPPSGIGFGNSIPDAPILFVGSKPLPQ